MAASDKTQNHQLMSNAALDEQDDLQLSNAFNDER
jgi:hypothetical protein